MHRRPHVTGRAQSRCTPVDFLALLSGVVLRAVWGPSFQGLQSGPPEHLQFPDGLPWLSRKGRKREPAQRRS